jgi:hypothetical protein
MAVKEFHLNCLLPIRLGALQGRFGAKNAGSFDGPGVARGHASSTIIAVLVIDIVDG